MTILCSDGKKRCFGGQPGKEFYARYHDNEWGIPVHDDQHLFEMLVLEGAQAGLSWETILKRREGYRKNLQLFSPLCRSPPVSYDYLFPRTRDDAHPS